MAYLKTRYITLRFTFRKYKLRTLSKIACNSRLSPSGEEGGVCGSYLWRCVGRTMKNCDAQG